ncbi:NADH:ubiquinone oxidoreductase subunit NDUFA12 [Coralliovum pocilloporae]|uniref:NADH:ubiquinone oxidoreductase subunit NDUFA12 n=1 Tax=Coralliovum pocilloporae TaxID=3066369 RepID=UPI0033073DF4
MKQLLLQIFTWWNGQTMGTRFFTWRKGEFVGKDEFGNTYYRERSGNRRWVIYNGEADASAIPAGWHGWMHHRTDISPADETYTARDWETGHQPNPTGTANAYRPKGSILTSGGAASTPDYDAWSPEN